MNLASMQGKHTSIMGIIREQGFMSLYDGLSAGVMRQVFYASSRLGLFDTCRDMLHEYRGKTDFAGRWVTNAFDLLWFAVGVVDMQNLISNICHHVFGIHYILVW